MKKKFKYGPWNIEYTPEDGARLNRILYNGFDLVTVKPKKFRKPKKNYGEYENRPVYGYDDCFPSVVSCPFPGVRWRIPDHGEVCWLKWKVEQSEYKLSFSTESKVLPAVFKREMEFSETNLIWRFEVINKGRKVIPFQHVMHPLMKLDDVSGIHFPEFGSAFNATEEKKMKLKTPSEMENYLLSQPVGTANMLYLRKIKEGRITWAFRNGLLVKMIFPKKYFSTIGIWWNNSGYPDEKGIRRNECAFEPVPGATSSLSESFEEGKNLEVAPGKSFKWQIIWELNN